MLIGLNIVWILPFNSHFQGEKLTADKNSGLLDQRVADAARFEEIRLRFPDINKSSFSNIASEIKSLSEIKSEIDWYYDCELKNYFWVQQLDFWVQQFELLNVNL